MEQLTTDELAVLPEWVADRYRMFQELRQRYASDEKPQRRVTKWQCLTERLIGELARALTPQPCGHPRGCIVSSPYIDGVGSAMSCGWCEAEEQRKIFRTTAKNFDTTIGLLRKELWTTKKERDALRERLAVANSHVDLLKRILIDLDNEEPVAFGLLCQRHDVPNELLIDCGLIYAENLPDDGEEDYNDTT